MFAMRLLELEQKFESYCTIHDEELKEIKSTLDQLREDLLSINLEQAPLSPQKQPTTTPVLRASENPGEKDQP